MKGGQEGVPAHPHPAAPDQPAEELCSEVKGRTQSKSVQTGSGPLREGGLLSQSWKVRQGRCPSKGTCWEGTACWRRGWEQEVCGARTFPVGLSFPSPILR